MMEDTYIHDTHESISELYFSSPMLYAYLNSNITALPQVVTHTRRASIGHLHSGLYQPLTVGALPVATLLDHCAMPSPLSRTLKGNEHTLYIRGTRTIHNKWVDHGPCTCSDTIAALISTSAAFTSRAVSFVTPMCLRDASVSFWPFSSLPPEWLHKTHSTQTEKPSWRWCHRSGGL